MKYPVKIFFVARDLPNRFLAGARNADVTFAGKVVNNFTAWAEIIKYICVQWITTALFCYIISIAERHLNHAEYRKVIILG